MRPAQSGERSVPEVGLKQRERRAWSIVLLWTIGIFLAIPLARTVEGFVRDHIGNVFFGWFVISVVAVATAFALRSVLARGRVADNSQRSGLFWLLGVAVLSCSRVPNEPPTLSGNPLFRRRGRCWPGC